MPGGGLRGGVRVGAVAVWWGAGLGGDGGTTNGKRRRSHVVEYSRRRLVAAGSGAVRASIGSVKMSNGRSLGSDVSKSSSLSPIGSVDSAGMALGSSNSSSFSFSGAVRLPNFMSLMWRVAALAIARPMRC